jgi:hypothetical protein
MHLTRLAEMAARHKDVFPVEVSKDFGVRMRKAQRMI